GRRPGHPATALPAPGLLPFDPRTAHLPAERDAVLRGEGRQTNPSGPRIATSEPAHRAANQQTLECGARMTTALVLGKFAPLHRGHQRLFDTALAENDHLVVMVYDAPETGLSLEKRVGWIRRLYPHAEVLECTGGPA